MSQALADNPVMSPAAEPSPGRFVLPRTMPRWLHGLAIATVCLALPLLLLGAQVTTLGAGMVDQQSVRTPWHIFTVSFNWDNFAYLIEHSHRFFGWLVGASCIVLAITLWRSAESSWLRWLGWFALVMVGAQGVLGIIRVKFNALAGTEFALIHGLFAQLAFATLVSVAVVTSRRWQRATAVSGVDYRGIALALALMVYTQIVFGAQVRHLLDRTAQRLHVLFAFALAVVVVWLFVRIRSQEKVSRGLHRFSWLLCGLLAVQVILGVEAWMHRFGAGVPAEMVAITPGRMVVRTAHFLVGALLFSASVAFALWAWRPVGSIAFANASTPEGAA